MLFVAMNLAPETRAAWPVNAPAPFWRVIGISSILAKASKVSAQPFLVELWPSAAGNMY